MNENRAIPVELLERIEGCILPYSVGIWPNYTDGKQPLPWKKRLVASGTLVDLHGTPMLLTVGHFWLQLIKLTDRTPIDGICLGIKSTKHITLRFSDLKESDIIDDVRSDILNDSFPKQGPDLLLIRIPTAKAEMASAAGKQFYSWGAETSSIPYEDQAWTLVGYPVELADKDGQQLSTVAATSKLVDILTTPDGHRYVDFQINVEKAPYRGFDTKPEAPGNLGGLSGSGLWYSPVETQRLSWRGEHSLQGVACFEYGRDGALRTIRCHARSSLQMLFDKFEDRYTAS
ncbi:hypothetical protein ACFLU6_13770 [Acidobacteriota bacterium]